MVSTVKSPNSLSLTCVTWLLASFLIIILMSTIDNLSTEATDIDGKHSRAGHLPLFSDEEPTEQQLLEWTRQSETAFRKDNMLNLMAATAERTAEYVHRPRLVAPTGASETFVASVDMKNQEIKMSNSERDMKWSELLRRANDRAAAILTESLRPRADMRLKALLVKHAYAPPHSTQINGGAMWRDLLALQGNLDSEAQEETCFKAYVYLRDNPLPSNATAQQFATR